MTIPGNEPGALPGGASAPASRLFEALFAHADGFIELRVITEGPAQQHWFRVGAFADAARRAVELRGHGNVYFGVAPRVREKGTKDAVAHVPALWVDVDDPAATIELAAFPLPPSFVVKSGSAGGHHAYWLLREPVEPREAERLNRCLAEALGADHRVTDAGRVLRVPGTLNHKHEPPAGVELVHSDGTRYEVEQLIAALPADDRVVGEPDARHREGGAPEPVGRVLERLEGVRATGSGWTALCPAHDDRRPSLTVSEGDDGRCLLKCHAGCTTEAVVAAIGMSMADLFADDQHDDRRSLSAVLVDLAHEAEVDLFRDRLDQPLAVVPVDGHREVWRVKSTRFQRWLRYRLYAERDRVASGQALSDAIEQLAGQALFQGDERDVFVRVANAGERVFVDLGDSDWRVVEVEGDGWRVLPESPVAFVRRPSSLALPEPARGGSIDALRPFLNLADDRSWYLVVAFLVSALAGIGPFPILVLQGEQGSAKTTTARMLRMLVDPVKAMLRAGSPVERDLMIAASGQWLLGFDNVSNLRDRLADTLCQISTGAGFATRQLHTDAEEVVFEAMRPTIINGIAGISQRGDFLSRALLIELPQIAEGDRQVAAKLWQRFETEQPHLFGALLDIVVGVMRELPDVELTEAPRLADFAQVGTAVEGVCGWPAGSFLDALDVSQSGGAQDVLDGEPIAAVLQRSIASWLEWEGTATELLEALNQATSEELKRQRTWPKNAAQLGIRLKRITPALREVGVLIEKAPAGRDRAKQRGISVRYIAEPDAPVEGNETEDGDDGDDGDGGRG